jgi:hypothetical protein
VKQLKEPTRASLPGRQSVFRKPKGQEKNIPHSQRKRIQAAAAGLCSGALLSVSRSSRKIVFSKFYQFSRLKRLAALPSAELIESLRKAADVGCDKQWNVPAPQRVLTLPTPTMVGWI